MEKLFIKFKFSDFKFFNRVVISKLLGDSEDLLITDWKEYGEGFFYSEDNSEEVTALYESIYQNLNTIIEEERDDTYTYFLVSYAGVKVLLINEEFDEKCFVMINKNDLKNIL